MKVFIDTNVILEYTMERERAEIVDQLFDTLQSQGHQKLMSVGGFYTMLYVTDKFLKKELLVDKNQRIKMIRSVMQRLLQNFSVAEHDNASLLRGITDENFTDLEDSCQYQLAQRAGCQALITFNVSDYRIMQDSSVKVLSPEEYLNR